MHFSNQGTRTSRRRLSLVLALVAAIAVGSIAGAGADTYEDPAYRDHDLDNIARSMGPSSRGANGAMDAEHVQAALVGGAVEWMSNLGTQVEGLPEGRLYLNLGQLIPGAGVGEPTGYASSPIRPVEVDFPARTGALLHGRLWWDGRPGPLPGIVITSGSIQAPASAYHWAARSLAAAGYLVLTWDPQGQGESETFGHAPGDPTPTFDGFPSQQEANFVDGTVDALDFLLSGANPLRSVLDAGRLGLAGHSLGARAVSVVQQCSDQGEVWRDVAACGGRSYPIRALVAWDRLSAGSIVPVVPAMDQQADGYFLNPQPTFEAPAPEDNLGAFTHWQAAGVDTFAFTVRGGTHCEWSYIPLVCNATGYGLAAADLYTTAWFDRYLHPDGARNAAAGLALAQAWVPDGLTGGVDELAWRANFLSARVRSAIDCACLLGLDAPRVEVDDIRAAAGLSPVGDWAGANADRPAVRPV